MVTEPDPEVTQIMRAHVLPHLPESWRAVFVIFKPPPPGVYGVVDTPTQVSGNAHHDLICQVMETVAAQMRNGEGEIDRP